MLVGHQPLPTRGTMEILHWRSLSILIHNCLSGPNLLSKIRKTLLMVEIRQSNCWPLTPNFGRKRFLLLLSIRGREEFCRSKRITVKQPENNNSVSCELARVTARLELNLGLCQRVCKKNKPNKVRT